MGCSVLSCRVFGSNVFFRVKGFWVFDCFGSNVLGS